MPKLSILALSLVVVNTTAFAEKWDEDNNPTRFSSDYEYHFNSLPKKAVLPKEKMPWSSSYWPRYKGSLNYHWNAKNKDGFEFKSPSIARLKTMSQAELSELSPAEKFDLVQGHYDYPFSKSVLKGSKKTAKHYEGICDGWTATAIQFAEPQAVTVANPDGLMIPFGSSDVKALMSYDVSINQDSSDLGSIFVGSYCRNPLGLRLGTNSCQDLNPGAFHVIVANELGIKKESFAVDIDPTYETWNQPVYGYEFQVTGSIKAKEGVARAVTIHAKFSYAQDDSLDPNDFSKIFNWNPTIGTVNYLSMTKEFDYVLELDYSDRIIGGYWLDSSKFDHPDLFWKPTKEIKFTKEFEAIYKIYKPNL